MKNYCKASTFARMHAIEPHKHVFQYEISNVIKIKNNVLTPGGQGRPCGAGEAK